MKRFDEFRTGDRLQSEFAIAEKDLDKYIEFARVKNAFLEEGGGAGGRVVPGRALLSRIEGEFSRLEEVYGNHIILAGYDGDPDWDGRSTRFLAPVYTGDTLRVTYVISGVEDVSDEYGRISVDYEAAGEGERLVLLSRCNIYRARKNPPPAAGHGTTGSGVSSVES
ncbi:MAG: hypothetical protein OXI27_04555 [Thaumarchaeota archaeon]|nr:hypothetical protein [Nitrososphaerota archaeon]